METLTTPDQPKRARGRPGGILPADYDHAVLLDKFHSLRKMDLTELCRVRHISRQHFYDIINGRVNATRERVEIVAKALGCDPNEIIRSTRN